MPKPLAESRLKRCRAAVEQHDMLDNDEARELLDEIDRLRALGPKDEIGPMLEELLALDEVERIELVRCGGAINVRAYKRPFFHGAAQDGLRGVLRLLIQQLETGDGA